MLALVYKKLWAKTESKYGYQNWYLNMQNYKIADVRTFDVRLKVVLFSQKENY